MPATRGDRGAVAQLADVRHSLQKKSVGCTIGVGQARGQNRHGDPGIDGVRVAIRVVLPFHTP